MIRAAGGVLRRSDGAIAVVHRPRHDDWSLPKGKLDDGEHRLVAACREVREETGVAPVVGRRLPRQRYVTPDGPKLVDYWAMRAGVGYFTANDEVDALSWLDPDAAARLLTYDRDRAVLAAFRARPEPTATVLLVRHAHAGKRSQWSGADELRPLDALGSEQAQTLRRVLAFWAPTAVLAADRVRCVQTVQPLATDLALSVGIEPALSDEAAATDPARTLDRLRAIAGGGGVTALCSQGGAIPDLLARIAAADEVRLGRITAKKGSVWALDFTGTRLLGGDYYPHFTG